VFSRVTIRQGCRQVFSWERLFVVAFAEEEVVSVTVIVVKG
jgi:hypothetical protein